MFTNIKQTLNECLMELEDAHVRCLKGVLLIDEGESNIQSIRKRLKDNIPKDSIIYRIIDRGIKENTLWWEVTGSKYINKHNCSNFQNEIATIQSAINELDLESGDLKQTSKDHYIIDGGNQYQAIRIIYKLLSNASRTITIIDAYLDEKVFDYLESLENNISLYLLTEKYKPIFKTLYEAMKQQRPNIEAKTTSKYHDRFIILDEIEVWQLGTSINQAGNKVFMINKIRDEATRNQFITDLQAEWSKSKSI